MTEFIVNFFQLVGKLKRIPRTGWVLRNVPNPETISGHMYRMGLMAMMLPDSSGVDKNKCLKMALVHDIGECIIGDITPFCGISQTEKREQENKAIEELSSLVGDAGPMLSSIYQEYEAQETAEAQLVKELDRLDMILQAYEYEVENKTPGNLEEFFASTKGKFKHPWTVEIVNDIYRRRELFLKTTKT